MGNHREQLQQSLSETFIDVFVSFAFLDETNVSFSCFFYIFQRIFIESDPIGNHKEQLQQSLSETFIDVFVSFAFLDETNVSF